MRRPVALQPFVATSALLAGLAIATALAPAGPALAFPPAGTDNLAVAGQASVSSRIGQETISLSGTATIQRGDPQLQGGVEVVPVEITALSLQGNSVTGPVSVTESTSLASTGEVRALQPPPDSYPASSFLDVYVTVGAPASPGGSITLHNGVALHLVATADIVAWPPASATYAATPDPCVPLIPSLPKDICITSLAFTIGAGATVGGVTELPDTDALAANGRGPSSRDTAVGIVIGLAGLTAAVIAGWHARRLLPR